MVHPSNLEWLALQPHAERAKRAERVGWKRLLGGLLG